MNEHDSQRLARLLEADGMEATDDLESADVVLLNTCCIRENADNKLYGHLGHLKALKDRRPGMQIAVGGCLAQKDGELVQVRAPHVDVVFGTHNVANAAALLRRAELDGPIAEVPAVCEHLHLPLQAGSDRVLAAMRRGYTAERYMRRLASARSAVPELAVTTDLIVGFPGETDDDFERTLAVVAEAEYDSAYTVLFSPRPGA